MDRIRVAAHAKVNLFLHVLAREESGFHSIETLFALLDLHDDLTIEKIQTGIEISVEGADTGPDEDNLAFRAAGMVLDSIGRPFGVRICLEKAIPVQAGLGGGSSDGAATLRAVNTLANNALTENQILQLAAKLGSDVPFLASRAPYAVGWGHGERMFTVAGPPAAPALVMCPDFGVSTKEAYELLSGFREDFAPNDGRVLSPEVMADWAGIRTLSSNDFERVLLDREPRLRDVFSGLEATDPMITRLCGSGSAIFAIYDSERKRDAAQDSVSDAGSIIPTHIRAVSAPVPQVV